MSYTRNIKRGNLKAIWNATFKRMDFFKRTRKGKFILCNPFQNRFISTGPGYTKEQIAAMQKRASEY